MDSTKKFISTAELKVQRRSTYYKMLEDAACGKLIKIKRGIYVTPEQLSDTMIDVERVVPGGVLCLWSAWNIHGLTTAIPQSYHVAIERGRRVVTPSYPAISLHHYSAPILNIGIMRQKIEGFDIKIYDMERCVCDAVKFRNKVGIDVCAEIIDNYLKLRNRNLSRLMNYAKQLRVISILEKYLEVKL